MALTVSRNPLYSELVEAAEIAAEIQRPNDTGNSRRGMELLTILGSRALGRNNFSYSVCC
jgi:hypothetical protein